MLNIVMLIAIIMNAIMMNVVAPCIALLKVKEKL
jgi:hypothetical protein